jgi:hypothetical protein
MQEKYTNQKEIDYIKSFFKENVSYLHIYKYVGSLLVFDENLNSDLSPVYNNIRDIGITGGFYFIKRALFALIEFDHCGYMIYLSHNEIKILANLGSIPAILIEPFIRITENINKG